MHVAFEFQDILGTPHLVGSRRIGNQVDQRPTRRKRVRASRLGAMLVQESIQRELEKASKEKKSKKPMIKVEISKLRSRGAVFLG